MLSRSDWVQSLTCSLLHEQKQALCVGSMSSHKHKTRDKVFLAACRSCADQIRALGYPLWWSAQNAPSGWCLFTPMASPAPSMVSTILRWRWEIRGWLFWKQPPKPDDSYPQIQELAHVRETGNTALWFHTLQIMSVFPIEKHQCPAW